MPVLANASREHFSIPGIDHQTLASLRDGLAGLEIWHQTLDPSAETHVHYHDCEEVVVVLEGSRRATIAGEAHAFGPDSTLIIPGRGVHQLVNTGDVPMRLLAAFPATPARGFAPDGAELALPWQA